VGNAHRIGGWEGQVQGEGARQRSEHVLAEFVTECRRGDAAGWDKTRGRGVRWQGRDVEEGVLTAGARASEEFGDTGDSDGMERTSATGAGLKRARRFLVGFG
jgi:hypothetical protein